MVLYYLSGLRIVSPIWFNKFKWTYIWLFLVKMLTKSQPRDPKGQIMYESLRDILRMTQF